MWYMVYVYGTLDIYSDIYSGSATVDYRLLVLVSCISRLDYSSTTED